MATTIWDQAIDKNVDWGGDKSTGGAPVSGKRVQEFIKNSLNQKFGYLKYDKAALKYYVFADEENYNLYANDTTGAYANLLLGTFDAPAPATITISNQSAQQLTVLLGSTGNRISFDYYIENSAGMAVAENVTMRMAFTVGGATTSVSETLAADYDNYQTGVHVTKDISQYLSREGNYTVTVTLTGATTTATTTFSFMYTVVELRFSTTFDNTTTIPLENNSFEFNYQVIGGAGLGKMVEIFVDGEKLYQDGLGYGSLAISSGDVVSSKSPATGNITLYLKDNNDNTAKWPLVGETFGGVEFTNEALAGKDIFSSGKHSLQVRFSIPGNGAERIYSKTIYRDFIVSYPVSDTGRYVYIMYASDDITPGTVRDPQLPIEFTCEQYNAAKFNVSVYDSKGNDVVVTYKMTNEGETEPFATPEHTVNASTNWLDTFIYNFTTTNNVKIEISDEYTKQVQLQVNVTVNASEAAGVEEYDDNQLFVKYSALNRNNGETDKAVWKNESNFGKTQSRYEYPATFNNVLWNDQSGWDGEALVLSNGATVTFPFNLFADTAKPMADGTHFISDSGMTFEIELETFNVQDDNIPIMTFTDNGVNRSYIKINATQAEIATNANVKLKTNFKDGERIKIAFVINALRNSADVMNEWDEYNAGIRTTKPFGYYNMLFIYVNGVLDRVCKWGSGNVGTDSFAWTTPTGPNATSFTIGNPDGKASVKLYSMRVYRTAITPEQELMNYTYDAGSKLFDIWKRNNITENDEISMQKIINLGHTPIIIISTAYNELNNASNKKYNWVTNMQFIDPIYPELGFYARDIYMSCQGTSSMQYPIKNLRPYFGKTPSKTQKAKVTTVYDSEGRPTGESMQYTPEYLVEFWPYSEYGNANELTINEYVDTPECPLPFGTNKKVDADGYHKIAAGRTQAGRDAIATMWKERTDIYGHKDYLYAQASAEQIAAGNPAYFIINNLSEAADKTKAVRDEGDLVKYYISTFRPVRLHDSNSDVNGGDGKPMQNDTEYDRRVREMRYAGVKLYTRKEYKSEDGYEFGKFIVSIDGVEKELLAVKNADGEVVCTEKDGVLAWNLDKTIATIYIETKKKKSIYDKKGNLPEYYLLGAQWRQWLHHGYTDRWTLKADYAESSNTHNGGTARLWGEAMKGVQINGVNVCQTSAQAIGAAIDDFFDVRTSCDCRPSVLFYKEFKGYDKTTGKRLYNDPKFGGIYNIMTDKSSTKLFGFEDLYDEKGTKVFDASLTQCWECRSNGSLIAQGASLAMDMKDDKGTDLTDELGDGRLIWSSYESRWPDTGQERHEGNDAWPDDVYGVESNALESFWQWCNFCMPAINYQVGDPGSEHEGYTMNEYIQLTMEQATALYNEYIALVREHADGSEVAKKTLYIRWINANNDAYAAVRFPNNEYDDNGETISDIEYGEIEEYTDNYYEVSDGETKDPIFNPNSGIYYYRHDTEINYEAVTKTVNTQTIGEWLRNDPERNGVSGDIYIGHVMSFDSQYRCKGEDGQPDQDEQNKYLVDVYVWRGQGNRYKYINRFGEIEDYPDQGSIDPNDYLTTGGQSWGNKTFMQFFSATKYEHIDVYKCAAYYVYIIRFCAVDQVIKNTMMATEGPTESSNGNYVWWFINYDNDTILGVRNDGQLKFHWDCDRDTYDTDGNSYSYAGAKSVLWNNLGMDKDFMDIVARIDQAMFDQDLLSVNAVLGMYNEKQEGTWCECIYNEQEKIKYLETFQKDFSTDKYLLFMHGNRHAHRTWWVNHRWELYDSMWGTGSYLDKKIRYYLIINDAGVQNPVDFLTITAAAKYYFTTQSNNITVSDHWFKELGADESYTFKTETPIAIGDPMVFVGPQKVKIMDFRKGSRFLTSTISMSENYDITNADGTVTRTNWIKEAGAMMTKLLIGDGSKAGCGVTGVNGIDNITSLEEVDLRNFKAIEQSPVIGNLVNLHRWRTSIDDESRDKGKLTGMTIFAPAQGCTFYEVSLPKETTTITLNRVTFTTANENLVDATVNYTFTQPDPENPVENPAFKYCKTYDEVTNTLVPHNDYTFNAETGESSGDFYVFDYAPTATLSNLTFNNVTGIDTLQFIKDWLVAIENAKPAKKVTQTDAEYEQTVKNHFKGYSLNLQGMQWTGVTPSEVIEIYNKLNIVNFTGHVYLLGSDEGKLTQEEYAQIVNVFGNEAFKADNKIVFNAAKNMFFGPAADDTHTATIYEQGDTSVVGLMTGDEYYTIVRGESFKVDATIFPVTKDTRYVYSMQYYNANTNRWVEGTLRKPTDSYKDYVYYNENRAITLTNKDGYATFTADETGATVSGTVMIQIRVLGVDENGEPNYNYSQNNNNKYIYIKLVEQVLPQQSDLSIKERVGSTDVAPTTIVDKDVHTYVLNFGSVHNTMNVAVKNITVTPSSELVTVIPNSIVIDNDNKEYTFQLQNSIPETTTRPTVSVDVVFRTTDNRTITKAMQYDIEPIYPTGVTITGPDGNEVENSIYLNQTGTFDYTFSFTPANYNIDITNITIVTGNNNMDATEIRNDEITTEGFKLRIRNNFSGGNYQSFLEEDTYVLTFEPKYNDGGNRNIERTIEYSAAIVYPGQVELTRNNFDAQGRFIGSTNNPDIYLINNQGTTGSGSYNQLEGQGADCTMDTSAIRYKFNVKPSSAQYGDVTESYHVEIDTAALGVADITTNEAKRKIFNLNNETNITDFGIDLEWDNYPVDGDVTDKGCVSTGVRGFYISVAAWDNEPGEFTGSIPVKVSYDENDNDGTTEFNKTISRVLTFKIARTIASATSYDGLRSTNDNGDVVVYAVDKDRCFYEIEWDYENNIPANASKNTILSAHREDPESWVGVAIDYVQGTGSSATHHPICMALRALDTLPMVPYIDNNGQVMTGDESMASENYCGIATARVNANYTSEGGGEGLYNGYEITKYVLDTYRNDNYLSYTKWYKAYHLYDDVTMTPGMKVYFPASAEMAAFLDNAPLMEGMLKYLKSLDADADLFTRHQVWGAVYYFTSTFSKPIPDSNEHRMRTYKVGETDGDWTNTASVLGTNWNNINCRAFITINDEPLNA